ncbi:unnamed protein product [Cuscuta epithymum]|uniref:Phototropic-responsive NPH3 family protein n=1 Tax=Cuscuta epithymum TaxID=186058 RepID=A0AAV0E7I4_9ASTE|nr:unnamed protein product [Cuscuta epithymum]
MKFMKLGSKPDLFQSEGDNIRYVASELATDMVIDVGNVRFYLHKFPLLSKSARLQRLVASSNGENPDEINIPDIPGGAAAFEICAKYCYGMTVTLNPYNVVATRCAAEYLEMNETAEKGNLIFKIEVFLTSSIFRTWKDSIIALQTTRSFLPWPEDLKIVNRCLDSIAFKASINPAEVDWSYTYNRRKLPFQDGSFHTPVPDDWWVEDLCELHIDLYKRVIKGIKGKASGKVIGEALKAYAYRRLPGFSKGTIKGNDPVKCRHVVDTIVCLLPTEKNGVHCSFLLKLLQASIALECGGTQRRELIKRIGLRLEEATVADLLIQESIDIVQEVVEQFVMGEGSDRVECRQDNVFESNASKTKVATLVDGYLMEVARDPSLPLPKFVGLAEMVSGFPRRSHDGIYRAIDMYLKEHPGITKSERKRICRLMDCKKLSAEGCMHAVQNERLPLRAVVQLLFFEQLRSATTSSDEVSSSSTTTTSNLPGRGSLGSSRTVTEGDEDWDSVRPVPTAEEEKKLKALKVELGNLKLKESAISKTRAVASDEVKSLIMSKKKKIFSKKMWRSNKDGQSENSSSDTSDSPAASRSRRHSLSS